MARGRRKEETGEKARDPGSGESADEAKLEQKRLEIVESIDDEAIDTAADGPTDPIADIDIGSAKTDVGGHLLVESSGIASDPYNCGWCGAEDEHTTESCPDKPDDGSVSDGGPPDPASTVMELKETNRKGKKVQKTLAGARGGKKGPGIVRKGVGKTLGLAKTVIMTAVLISVAGAGVDVYQTYNDAMEIDLEEHITDADFELSDDKSEISGTVGFDIPEMGMFEKSIIASVHVTVLESNPTTEGDYKFEYTLGSGEQFYDFTLGNLDPVTVEKIEAGEPLDLEYSGTISVTYFGVEIPSVTMDIPLTTTTVETA